MSSITITNAGLNLFRNGASGTDNPLISYVAIGTGNSTPSASQTKLDVEVFRKAIAGYTNGASTGEILVNGIIGAGDAVGVVIAEVAFFGGSAASATANSGVMVARGLYSHTKGNETLQLVLDATF